MIPAAYTAINTAISATTALNTIKDTTKKAAKTVSSLSAQTSLSDVAHLSRAEFLTLVDNDCLNVDFLPEVNQSVLSIAIGYYLQALAVLGTVDSAKVVTTLSRVNPNARFNSDRSFSLESHQLSLTDNSDGRRKMALESYKWKLPTNQDDVALENDKVLQSFGKDGAGASLSANSNLSVGKFVDVKLKDGDGTVITLPVSFRLNVKVAPSKDLISILDQAGLNKTFVERFHAWREGEIEFIKDFLLCNDLIKERKRLLMNDKSGALTQLISRTNKSRIHGLLSKNPSLGAATSIFVISSTTAKELEKSLVGSLDDFRIRTRVFESGHMLLLVVIDKQFEEITFYHRGLADPTTLRLRDIKMANKDSGPNLVEIMTAFMRGNNPTF